MNGPNLNISNFFTLAKSLINEVVNLIKSHLLLLQEDLADDAERLAKLIVFLVAGFLVGYIGLFFIGIAFIVLLSLIMPIWAAVVIVALIYWVIPVLFLLGAYILFKKIFLTPKKSIEQIKKTSEEFSEWLHKIK